MLLYTAIARSQGWLVKWRIFDSYTVEQRSYAARYSGDATFSASNGSLSLTVTAKSLKLAASSVTVTAGKSGGLNSDHHSTESLHGTVAWTVSSSPALTNGCFSIANTTVSGTTAIMATLTVNTIASACPTPALVGAGVDPRNILDATPLAALKVNQASMAVVGLLLVGLVARRCRKLATLATLCILVTIGLAASGCASAGSSTPPSSPTAAKGTYTITIVGTDTTTPSITASTSLALTIN